MNNDPYQSLLITGGAGFIGSNFVHYWHKQYPTHKIVVLDALTYAGNLANIDSLLASDRVDFVKGNIGDTLLVEQLITEYASDCLVHFAAESHVDRSIEGPDAFIETNIIGTHSLLKAAKKIWLDNPASEGKTPLRHRFHHVSTDEVYGTLSPTDPPFSEDKNYEPNSPYSASKAASDHLVRAYHHTYGLHVTTSNCSNNYGPYHFPEKLIPLVITHILKNKPLPVYGDGLQVRDWLYVEDHARGIDQVIQQGRLGECYNIGGLNEWANIDIIKLICELMDDQFKQNPALTKQYPEAIAAKMQNSASLIRYVTDRAGHDRRYAIDPTKSREELGYEPKESFNSGIHKTVVWYLTHCNWWLGLIGD